MLLLCFLSVPQQCKLVCTLLVLDIPILSEGIDQIVICPIMSFFMKAHIKSVYFKIKNVLNMMPFQKIYILVYLRALHNE